jgi:type I protein arginine methyltransferase
MYSLSAYGRMITDKGRMSAYAEALRRTVTRDSVVIDIGTGTGILAILACQLGARKVFAIEPSDAIIVARDTAAANGFTDRIQFFQQNSKHVTLPERATVLVSDLRGVLPLLRDHIPTIVDARQRLLTKDAVQIPVKDKLYAAVVEGPDLYRRYVEPWDRNEFDLDLRSGQKLLLNTWRKVRVAPDQLLSSAECFATVDYLSVESSDLEGDVTLTVTRKGMGHGLNIWFDAVLADEVTFSNGPAAPELIYGSGFFPWLTPVSLEVRDSVKVGLNADLVGDDYVWRWETKIFGRENSHEPKAHFKQSTFFGAPIAAAQLRKRAAGHVPVLNDDGEAERLILSMMDGRNSLQQIAEQLCVRFPSRFQRWEDALSAVGRTSLRYSD